MSPSSRPFACGGFSRRKPEEREPSALGAPGLFVRPHAQLEGALRRRHVASGERGPAHLAVDARDLGLIADRGERLERFAVNGQRPRLIAGRESGVSPARCSSLRTSRAVWIRARASLSRQRAMTLRAPSNGRRPVVSS